MTSDKFLLHFAQLNLYDFEFIGAHSTAADGPTTN